VRVRYQGNRYATVGIGQCVGAQNQKFFFVFVVWAALFSLWTFTTLLALNVRAISRTGITVDAEQVAVLVLYAPLPFPNPPISQREQIRTILDIHCGHGVDTYLPH
jgi:hypothetical protein